MFVVCASACLTVVRFCIRVFRHAKKRNVSMLTSVHTLVWMYANARCALLPPLPPKFGSDRSVDSNNKKKSDMPAWLTKIFCRKLLLFLGGEKTSKNTNRRLFQFVCGTNNVTRKKHFLLFRTRKPASGPTSRRRSLRLFQRLPPNNKTWEKPNKHNKVIYYY